MNGWPALRKLQIGCLTLLGIAVAAFSTWRYFAGGAWWVGTAGAVLAYVSLIIGLIAGDSDAGHRRAFRWAFTFALSTVTRAAVSLMALTLMTAGLLLLAYNARPKDTDYFEVRVYDQVDLPGHGEVGSIVVLHTRTDGLTHREIVAEDGGAVFRNLPVPTTLAYQIDVSSNAPPFTTGGNHRINQLPDQLDVDIALIPTSRRLTLIQPSTPNLSARPATYLAGVTQKGDKTLQAANAPWGVPEAPLVINRFSYVLGYDTERRQPRWVAYSTGPTTESVPRAVFTPDPAIPTNQQAATTDYQASGFDRGHLISPADLYFRGPVAVAEANYLSTVAPQTPWVNRLVWAKVEQRVRSVVAERGRPAYIIAGPLFESDGTAPQTIGANHIPVPTHFFRVVAMNLGVDGIDAFAVVIPNAAEGDQDLERYRISIREVERRSGLQFFPLLDTGVRQRIESRSAQLWMNTK